MVREYRIIRDNRISEPPVHFPQVRTRKFLIKFWFITLFEYTTSWKRIGEHRYSFALYDYLDHPKTYTECADIIEKYRIWIEREDWIEVAHTYNK